MTLDENGNVTSCFTAPPDGLTWMERRVAAGYHPCDAEIACNAELEAFYRDFDGKWTDEKWAEHSAICKRLFAAEAQTHAARGAA